jgi:polyferredoxin
VFVYSALLLAVISGLAYSLATRIPLELDVIRERNALYRVIAADQLENLYTLRIMNMDNAPHRFSVAASGLPGITVTTGEPEILIDGGEIRTLKARVRVDPGEVPTGGHDIVLTLQSLDRESLRTEEHTRFFVPTEG